MRSLLFSAATLSFMISASSAQAEAPCVFSAHEPVNLLAMLDDAFDAQGLYYLPKAFTALGVGQVGTIPLFRDDAVVAQIKLDVDTSADKQDLVVYDARGQWLLKAKMRVHACGDALCKEVEIKPRREANGMEHPDLDDGTDPNGMHVPVEARSPFFLRWRFPSPYPLETFVYGTPMEPGPFEAALGDSFQWLERAVATTTVTMPVVLTDAIGRLQFATVRDPLLRPYYELVKYTVTPRGSIVISGRVPSDLHYGRAIDLVREQGFIVADIRLIIDTRLLLPPEPPLPLSCDGI